MRLPFAYLSLAALMSTLLVPITPAQMARKGVKKRSAPDVIKICRGISIPDGYTIIAEATSTDCPGGAYVIKKNGSPAEDMVRRGGAVQQPPPASTASRPRRVAGGDSDGDDARPAPVEPAPRPQKQPPTLIGSTRGDPSLPEMGTSPATLAAAGPEEVGDGDVVRVDTTFISVPVSVMDRQGKYIPNLRREDFHIFENGVEQEITHFDPTEKPFTVALVLDTSGSTGFRLSEMKEAAISFANQLRPQDRVLVVTFNDEVLLLTEATSDRDLISAVINYNAETGSSTRLYDAIDLVIRERLSKITGRKAIVLFTDGVDTASHLATYESTMAEVTELDALIYPIQYDTYEDVRAQNSSSITIVSNSSGGPYPGTNSSSRVIYNIPSNGGAPPPGATRVDYERADVYLHNLAEKTGARLYRANDRQQLTQAFSQIAEELRRQYSLGYYPKTSALSAGERRQIKVRVRRPDLVVRARDSYTRSPSAGTR